MELLETLQVVVLMGGLGTRLGEAAAGRPKAMVDVQGRPFFEHMLALLRWQGFRRFLFCVGHGADTVEAHFGDGGDFGVEIRYSKDGPRLLGTGGALRKALPLLEDQFVLIYGDSYMDVEYAHLAAAFLEAQPHGAKALMSVFANRNRFDRSNVLFQEGRLVRYDKRAPTPDMAHIDYGISLIRREVIAALPADEPVDLADVFHQLSLSGHLLGCEVLERFYEIGTPASLEELRQSLAARSQVRPALFLDRDGTLNRIVFNEDAEQLDSPLKPEELTLLPGVGEALRILQRLGYRLIVVSNQPAAAKGKVSLPRLFSVNQALIRQLEAEGVHLDASLLCLHHPEAHARSAYPYLSRACECRKPRPGLLKRALERFPTDLAHSYMVGDSHVDVQAGRALGLRTVFLGPFKCDACHLLEGRQPDHLFPSLLAFARALEQGLSPSKAPCHPLEPADRGSSGGEIPCA